MDEVYRQETDRLRTGGRTLAEVSSLSVAPAFRRSGVATHLEIGLSALRA
jgi:ribosomal protein S18 acetylase RimI-like enzyme